MNINIAGVTQTIALLPEFAREVVTFARWNYPLLQARIRGDVETLHEILGDDDDTSEPLEPWQAGRLALEITTLIRSHKEFPKGHREAMDLAVHDVDSSQHAVDLIMALASMFAHVVTDEQIDMFSRSLVEAEARSE